MADSASVADTNGTAVADTESAVERPKLTRAQQDAADREAFLANVGKEESEEKPAPKKSKPKAESLEDEIVEDEVKEDEDEDEIEDLEDDEDELAGEAEDDEDEEEKAASDKEDPSLAKHREQLRKQEKRQRERLEQQATQRDAAFTKERDAFIAEWKPKVDAANAFERIAKHDVVGILKAKGYTEDDFADASKILWGLSKEGAAEPKNREAVARLQRDRDLREKADAAMAKADALEARLAKQESDQAQTKSVETYLKRVSRAVNDDLPLLKNRLEAAPKATRAGLEKMAFVMAKKAGELVDPRKVAKAYEKRLRSTVERASGLSELLKAAPAKAAPAAKAKPAAIKVEDRTTKAAPIVEYKKTNGSLLPSREDMIDRLGKIQRGELDPDAD